MNNGIGIGIDPMNSLLALQQPQYLNSLAQQQAASANSYFSLQNVAYPTNPDERLLVLLTEE